MTITQMTPPEVDNRLADISERATRARQHLHWACDELRRHAGEKGRSTRSGTVYVMLMPEALGIVNAKIAADEKSWQTKGMRESLGRYEKAQAELASLRDEARPYEDEYARRPWSRFFLVRNNGGHIHSSMNCSTCNKMGKNTHFGWLPDLSGLTEKDAVEAHGTILCSVCFPTAPVEWTVGKAADPNTCPGSGQDYIKNDADRPYDRYRECPACHQYMAITQYGLMRKHKTPKR